MIGWNFVNLFNEIKRINNLDLFSQTPLFIFTKGANISGGHSLSLYIYTVYIYIYIYILVVGRYRR